MNVTVLDVPAVASVAVAVTVAAARVVVGVPLILPELLMVRPVGSPVADQVTEPDPPLAVSWSESLRLTVVTWFGGGLGVSANGG